MTKFAIENFSLKTFCPKSLLVIISISLFLNFLGINWGVPGRWYHDEITQRAENMVGSFSLNPHYFAYGSFHYYPVMAFAVLPVKVPNKLFDLFDYPTQSSFVIILARSLSAFLGTATVALIYQLARKLFDQRTALLSAAFLTVSMGFVSGAHFATTDIPMAFWFTLACLFCTFVYKDGFFKWYVLAGLSTGFAAGVKYNGGIAIVSLLCAHFLRKEKNTQALFYGVGFAALGFVVANPVIFFSFFEFAEGFIKESVFNSLRELHQPRAFLGLFFHLKNALGMPLFLLTVSAIFYCVMLGFFSKKKRALLVLVLSMFLPYYIVMGSMHVSVQRYLVPILPFLAVISAVMVADFTRVKSQSIQVLARVVTASVLTYSLFYALAFDIKLLNDSRVFAEKWILQNVEPGSKIEITSYAPNIPEEKYIVVERPHSSAVDDTYLLTLEDPKFNRFREALGELESFAKQIGFPRKSKPYVAWYQTAIASYNSQRDDFDITMKGLESRSPDYVIASGAYYERFFGNDSFAGEAKYFDSLLSEKTNYKKVAEFRFDLPWWIDPQVELVNPQIYIFARKA